MYKDIDESILRETAEHAIRISQIRRKKLELMKEALLNGNESQALDHARYLCGIKSNEQPTNTRC